MSNKILDGTYFSLIFRVISATVSIQFIFIIVNDLIKIVDIEETPLCANL